MMSRRDLIAGASAVGFVPGAGSARAAGRSRIHAMIVAINSYPGRYAEHEPHRPRPMRMVPIRPLHGCLNDARAIITAIRPVAASMRVLLEAQATRAAFFQGWEATLAGCAPGDVIVLTFSGHGGMEPERVRGSEATGMDQTLILHGFDSAQPADRAERIVDDEIDELLARAEARGVRVVFVADCCNSGTMTRAIRADFDGLVSTRTVSPTGRYDIAAPLAPVTRSLRRAEQRSNVLFFAAAQDGEASPEISFGGAMHGALSVAFAEAIAGAGDIRRRGSLTGQELVGYVRRRVRAITDANQHPRIQWPVSSVSSGLDLGQPLIESETTAPAAAAPAGSAAWPVRIAILTLPPEQALQTVQGLKGAALAPSPREAALVWDAATRQVLTPTGQVIAHGIASGGLQAVVDRAAVVAAITERIGGRGLDMRLVLIGDRLDGAPSRAADGVHPEGTRLRLVITGLRHPNLVLFNVTGNGLIQDLMSRPIDTRQTPDGTYVLRQALELDVRPPFGAEHIVAVCSPAKEAGLLARLKAVDGKPAVTAVLDELKTLAGGEEVQLGLQGVYSRERP